LKLKDLEDQLIFFETITKRVIKPNIY